MSVVRSSLSFESLLVALARISSFAGGFSSAGNLQVSQDDGYCHPISLDVSGLAAETTLLSSPGGMEVVAPTHSIGSMAAFVGSQDCSDSADDTLIW